jgi:ABC-type phosphate transport system substrate-binding protein
VEFALTNEQGVTAQAPAQGFTLPSETTLQTGVSNLATVRTGRTFTRPLSPVSTSPDQLLGAVDVVGSAMLSNLITNTVISSTTAAYPGVTVNSSTLGNTAGLESLCAGEPPADVLQATRSFTDEELANCNNPYALNLGADALVLAVPASLEGVSCVTSDQAQALLGVYIPPVMATPEPAPAATEEAPVAGATEEAAPVVTEEAPVATEEAPVVEATEEPLPPAPELWSDVNPDWPELEILAVLPPRSSGETDFLGATLFGTQRFTTRTDGAESDDPLYRAQGVANTDNGFTYLWWSDLQGSAADLKLVEVDAGNGCVAPSAETIADGSYPLSYSVNYYFNQTSLTDPAVRVFLWQFFSNTVLDQLAGSSLVGLDIDALRTTLRDEIFTMLEALDVPVVTEEPTPAATEEPEVSATEEVAPVATEEVTPVATEEVAPAATEEATPVATEPAPAVTEEATPAAE